MKKKIFKVLPTALFLLFYMFRDAIYAGHPDGAFLKGTASNAVMTLYIIYLIAVVVSWAGKITKKKSGK